MVICFKCLFVMSKISSFYTFLVFGWKDAMRSMGHHNKLKGIFDVTNERWFGQFPLKNKRYRVTKKVRAMTRRINCMWQFLLIVIWKYKIKKAVQFCFPRHLYAVFSPRWRMMGIWRKIFSIFVTKIDNWMISSNDT